MFGLHAISRSCLKLKWHDKRYIKKDIAESTHKAFCWNINQAGTSRRNSVSLFSSVFIMIMSDKWFHVPSVKQPSGDEVGTENILKPTNICLHLSCLLNFQIINNCFSDFRPHIANFIYRGFSDKKYPPPSPPSLQWRVYPNALYLYSYSLTYNSFLRMLFIGVDMHESFLNKN